MSSRRTRLLTAIGVIGLTLTVGAVGVVATSGEKPAPTTFDAGKSEAQIEAEQSAGTARYEARLAEWYANLDVSKLDLGSLPRGELMVSLRQPPSSYRAAVAASARILLGKVTSIKPGPSGTDVTVNVERNLRGGAEAVVRFRQLATLTPMPDWKGAAIADSPGGALLLPGMRGVFLLNRVPDGSLRLQECTGEYVLAGDGIDMPKSNPFKDQFKGKSEAELIEATLDAS